MNPKQRVLITQLQIAGLGLVVSAFGYFTDTKPLVWVGFAVFAIGLLRLLFMKRLLGNLPEDGSDGESLDAILEASGKNDADCTEDEAED